MTTYTATIRWTVEATIEIEAGSKASAKKKIRKEMDDGEFDYEQGEVVEDSEEIAITE